MRILTRIDWIQVAMGTVFDLMWFGIGVWYGKRHGDPRD
jgi:hypothetical protein